jgi:hypothetical protein
MVEVNIFYKIKIENSVFVAYLEEVQRCMDYR